MAKFNLTQRRLSDLIVHEADSPFVGYTRADLNDSVVTVAGTDVLTLGTPVFRAKGAGLSTPAVAEVQTVVASGTATGQVSFLGTPIPGSATSDTAAVTAGLITTNKAAIIAAWNAANPDAAIANISNTTATITITYVVGTGDVPELPSATSEGITFAAATEATKGAVAVVVPSKWAPVKVTGDLAITNEYALVIADGLGEQNDVSGAGDHKVTLLVRGNVVVKSGTVRKAAAAVGLTDAGYQDNLIHLLKTKGIVAETTITAA